MSILLALRAWLPTIARLLPYIAIAGVIWWVADMRSDLSDVRDKNASLSRAIADEKQARQRDVSALTTLSAGMVQAASSKAIDGKVLSDAIDTKNPQPVSAGLRDLLDGLRAADGADVPATAGRAGGAAAR